MLVTILNTLEREHFLISLKDDCECDYLLMIPARLRIVLEPLSLYPSKEKKSAPTTRAQFHESYCNEPKGVTNLYRLR
jgi:hypothetical protein